jgi:putative tricarboxylic transport membrane protein
MTPGATPDQVNFYVELLKKVRETPEWKDLMKNGAFNQTFMTGPEYAKWVEKEEQRHRDLMKEAGFLASTN